MTSLIDSRKAQRNKAFKWSAILFTGFLIVTQQVYTYGPLTVFDKRINSSPKPQFEGLGGFILRRLDDLGLRGVTAFFLLVAAVLISRRFKSWRPINLSILSLLLLNFIVGISKLLFGRTKPSTGFDLVFTDSGLSYPSGHAANAIFTWGILAYLIFRYSHRQPFEGLRLTWFVSIITVGVCLASLYRNTHWFSDLLGGLFIGSALLVLVIAIDRSITSDRQPS